MLMNCAMAIMLYTLMQKLGKQAKLAIDKNGRRPVDFLSDDSLRFLVDTSEVSQVN
jgi:hypothetical protein